MLNTLNSPVFLLVDIKLDKLFLNTIQGCQTNNLKPPILNTYPCMKEMLTYEDYIFDAHAPQIQVIHPQWPTMWPRLLTDGKLLELKPENMIYQLPDYYTHMRPLSKKNKQFLRQCEEERFVFKACLRKLLSLHRTTKHTSWDTAPVSNLHLS